jgi:hypothetical protein
MSWTAPFTVVTNQVWTASAFNTYVRDDLLETAPGEATSGSDGNIFSAVSANSISENTIGHTSVTTSATTTSTTYTSSLSTGASGPSVTIEVNSKALAILSVECSNGTANVESYASIDVSGANTVAANDQWSVFNKATTGGSMLRCETAHLFTGFSPGSTTFTAMYRVPSGTGTFVNRSLIVIPF